LQTRLFSQAMHGQIARKDKLMSPDPKDLCTFQEAGVILGMHRNSVEMHVLKGRLKVQAVLGAGKIQYLSREAVERFKKERGGEKG